MAFTMVFSGDVRDIPGSPFKIVTPFGRAIAVSCDDALHRTGFLESVVEEADRLLDLGQIEKARAILATA